MNLVSHPVHHYIDCGPTSSQVPTLTAQVGANDDAGKRLLTVKSPSGFINY